jgi:predicted nucleic acid-binding protein
MLSFSRCTDFAHRRFIKINGHLTHMHLHSNSAMVADQEADASMCVRICVVNRTHLSASREVGSCVRAHSSVTALSLADRHVLALAGKHPGAIILTDDSLVRRIALAEGFPVAGTLGLLIRAVRANIMTQPESLKAVEALVSEHQLRVSVDLYQESLRQLR